jgi:predicted phosphodiesterase
MKIALLADIHGNLPGLQAVLEDLSSFTPDLIAVAGDLTGGPYSNQTLDLLRKLQAVLIVGNSDLNLLRLIRHEAPEEWYSCKQFGLLRWNARHLTSENYHFLASLPDQQVLNFSTLAPIRLVHGTPRSPFQPLYPDRDPASLALALQQIAEPVLVCGHTHEPWLIVQEGRLALNPGAVAGSLNGQTGAFYACLEWNGQCWLGHLNKVDYDLTYVSRAFEQSGLLKEGGAVALGFLRSIQTGKDVSLAFLNFAYQLAEQAGFQNCRCLPDPIWDQASQQFPWENY